MAPSNRWAAMSPDEQIEMLDAAPMIAGPWIEVGAMWCRQEYGPHGRWACRLEWNCFGGEWAIYVGERVWGTRELLGDAKAMADEELGAYGWVLR